MRRRNEWHESEPLPAWTERVGGGGIAQANHLCREGWNFNYEVAAAIPSLINKQKREKKGKSATPFHPSPREVLLPGQTKCREVYRVPKKPTSPCN